MACRIRKLFFIDFISSNSGSKDSVYAEIIKMMVFTRFQNYRKIEFLMSGGSFLEPSWKVFGVLRFTFGDFRKTWGYVRISMILEGGQGPHQVEGTRPLEGNGGTSGVVNNQSSLQVKLQHR